MKLHKTSMTNFLYNVKTVDKFGIYKVIVTLKLIAGTDLRIMTKFSKYIHIDFRVKKTK